MIAILHVGSKIQLVIPDVTSIEGGNVIGTNASARGTTADILVVNGFTCEADGSITNGSVTLRPGDAVNPADFTDTRNLLPKTPEQTIDKLEADNVNLNDQIIDLWETLLSAGVL